jgi:hypothetical protein
MKVMVILPGLAQRALKKRLFKNQEQSLLPFFQSGFEIQQKETKKLRILGRFYF